ncbi:hypothetical protein [Ferrimonas balearica]|uniref:hypothetical protein n=1 Tax=Ferrimonas balearica TaxID=44012 RepID=UPI001C99AB5C|nr:hypothetical protein [Ferrimonas balearica]MBY5990952.1 hypothetical protein [Ferrimonas balearica]
MRASLLLLLFVLVGCQSADSTQTSAPPAQPSVDDAVPVPQPGTLPGEGDRCFTNGDCQGALVCQGQGCPGDGSYGQCVNPNRPCTMDFATYCGCDGKEFGGSGSCPNARFIRKGQCLDTDLQTLPSQSELQH